MCKLLGFLEIARKQDFHLEAFKTKRSSETRYTQKKTSNLLHLLEEKKNICENLYKRNTNNSSLKCWNMQLEIWKWRLGRLIKSSSHTEQYNEKRKITKHFKSNDQCDKWWPTLEATGGGVGNYCNTILAQLLVRLFFHGRIGFSG